MEFLIDLIGSIIPYIKTAFLAIIPLGFIIFIHELGHFYAAKRCGIKVNTFSLGFGPKLIGFQRDETDYRISLLPFGGYVQMEGESPTEQTGAPGEFASASIGSRAFVVAAGPAVNLLFGVLIYWLVFATGINTDSARLIGGLTGLPLGEKEVIQLGWVADDGPGAIGGLMPGDTIISVNGDPISHWAMFQTRIFTSANRPLDIVVEREGERKILSVIPDAEPSVRGDIGIIRVSSRSETIISHVEEGSPAAEAGIQVGDQIGVRRREGRYLLRSNMVAEDPAELWRLYMRLVEIEQAFKELKHDLAVRPVFHQVEERIEAHIFVSFIAYCLLVTLKNIARPRAGGLTPRAIIEAFGTIQMVDVHLPTTDGRRLVLPRYTQPRKEHELLLHQFGMTLPAQGASRLSSCRRATRCPSVAV